MERLMTLLKFLVLLTLTVTHFYLLFTDRTYLSSPLMPLLTILIFLLAFNLQEFSIGDFLRGKVK